MAGHSFSTKKRKLPDGAYRSPTTSSGSRSLMLTAEMGDEVNINQVVSRIEYESEIPNEVFIRQRTSTYYGPKLLAGDTDQNEYLITSPGPDQELIIWKEVTNSRGKRIYWTRLAEIEAELSEPSKGYQICPQCNKPLKTAEHTRLAAIGQCQNV